MGKSEGSSASSPSALHAARRAPGDACDHRNRKAFDEQLPHDPPSRRAHRDADRDLALTLLAAHEEQSGRVTARDQQHQTDDADEHPRHLPIARRCLGLRDQAGSGCDRRERFAIVLRLGRRASARDDIELGLCLGDGRMRLEAADHLDQKK